jgi:tetratricopeptide (TPR) repeat protein
MGCVDEPYLGGTPDVGVFAARLIISGFTFGEAAYASQQVLSWQTTVVGDPLYRPFGIQPQQLHESLTARKDSMLEWSFLRLVNLNLVRGTPMAQMAAFLEGVELTKQSAVLTEKLADMYSHLGKPSSAIEMLERAVKLKPSPQQKIRIRLALGSKLAATEKFAEAAEDYGDTLQENPDYPSKIEIYRKLLPLAQKLGKKEAAANYEEKIKELSQPAK